MHRSRQLMALSVVAAAVCATTGGHQQLDKGTMSSAIAMLHTVRDTIAKNYFQAQPSGFDIDAEFQKAETEIHGESVMGEAILTIGRTVEKMNDSHTFFLPPHRNVVFTPGWRSVIVGDKCYIAAVEPNSDAAKQGVKPGDRLLEVNRMTPTRANYGSILYLLQILAPQPDFKMVLASPGEPSRDADPKSRSETFSLRYETSGGNLHAIDRYREGIRGLMKPRFEEVNADLMIWKLPVFSEREDEINHAFEAAKHHKSLILDLRENGGGAEEPLKWIIGNLYAHEQTIGDIVSRDGKQPMKIASRRDKAFTGGLIVIVDAGSASASELVAKTVQITKRGTIIGDRTEGAVGRAKLFPLVNDSYHYAMEVTISRIVFPDGVDLEGVGVTPEILSLPTAADMAAGRDPVMSAAAKIAGVDLTPEAAGKLFPQVWATY